MDGKRQIERYIPEVDSVTEKAKYDIAIPITRPVYTHILRKRRCTVASSGSD